jgi:hypothetical protein
MRRSDHFKPAMSTTNSEIKTYSGDGPPYDPTKLPTLICLVAGGLLALFAAALSGPIDPNLLGAMVAFP